MFERSLSVRRGFSVSELWSRIRSGRGRAAGYTLIDQGLVSAGNFLTGVVLARCLPEQDYGAYSVILETMLFLNSLQSATVVYPLMVQGARDAGDELRRRTSAALMFTLLLLPVLGLAMALGAMAAGVTSGNLWLAITAVSAMLLWQLQETLRRALLTAFRGGDCLLGDVVSYLGQALIIFTLYQHHWLTLPRVFATIGFTSGLAAIIQSTRVGLTWLTGSEVLKVAVGFWRLGRWTLLSAIVSSFTGPVYVWVLRLHGEEGPAVLAALCVPLKLANPILLAIGNLMMPAISRAYAGFDHRRAFRAAFLHALPGAIALAPMYAMLILLPGLALRLLLGAHSPYLAYAPLLRLYAISLAISFFEFTVSAYLGGIGESRANFLAQTVHAAAAVCIGIPATALYGVEGLCVSSIGMATISVIAQGIALYRTVKRTSASARTNVPPTTPVTASMTTAMTTPMTTAMTAPAPSVATTSTLATPVDIASDLTAPPEAATSLARMSA